MSPTSTGAPPTSRPALRIACSRHAERHWSACPAPRPTPPRPRWRAPAPSPACPGHGTHGRSLWSSGRLWLGIALIAAASVGYQQWLACQQLSELEETDAALLSSDLPIDAYLDRGFQNWIKISDE